MDIDKYQDITASVKLLVTEKSSKNVLEDSKDILARDNKHSNSLLIHCD